MPIPRFDGVGSPRRPRRAAGAVALLAVLAATAGCSSSNPSASRAATTTTAGRCGPPPPATTVAYEHLAGVPVSATSLDLHVPEGACDAPVVMWVHGGAYQVGDKSQQVADKVRLFGARGWILVSVNYRLTRAGDPSSARYPDHDEDVAAAVGWVHAHVAAWGGDPDRIALLGHSAGADIVANVVTNPRYLHDHGLELSDVVCAGPLDTEGFDKARAAPRTQVQWRLALGNAPEFLTTTSAVTWIRPGIGIPPMIGVVRGSPVRRSIEQGFLDRLAAAGVPTTRIDAGSLTHAEVNRRIGAPGDTVMTPPLVAFLGRCFAP